MYTQEREILMIRPGALEKRRLICGVACPDRVDKASFSFFRCAILQKVSPNTSLQ